MGGTEIRLGVPRVLPFGSLGGEERRACAVFMLEGGTVLVVQAACAAGEPPTLSAFATLRAADGAAWAAGAALAVDEPVPAPPSLRVSPRLLQGGADDFEVAWALESGAVLRLGPGGASVLEGLGEGRVTALGGDGHRLYVALRRDGAEGAGILSWSEPEGWRAVGARPLPCPRGEEVTAIEAFGGRLHVAVSGARTGFGLWRTGPDGGGDWEPVMTQGAWRYGYNRSVTAMLALGDRLLVGTDGPALDVVEVGDEHPEVMAVDPSGRWELVSGQARFSPEGLRRPSTSGGPGEPRWSGATIGGLQADGESVVAWLAPRGGGPGHVTSLAWPAGSNAWALVDTIDLPELAVTSVVAGAEGGLLVAGGGENGGPRRPLLLSTED